MFGWFLGCLLVGSVLGGELYRTYVGMPWWMVHCYTVRL